MKRFVRILVVILVIVMLSILAVYYIIFGRALKQDENHLVITLALPELIINGGAKEIDKSKLLVRRPDDFIKAMAIRGFVFKEQMGSGYFFEKSGKSYISVGRKYSAYFMLFSPLTK